MNPSLSYAHSYLVWLHVRALYLRLHLLACLFAHSEMDDDFWFMAFSFLRVTIERFTHG